VEKPSGEVTKPHVDIKEAPVEAVRPPCPPNSVRCARPGHRGCHWHKTGNG
jgi:hypothetical protein